jgi:hypothetical protein
VLSRPWHVFASLTTEVMRTNKPKNYACSLALANSEWSAVSIIFLRESEVCRGYSFRVALVHVLPFLNYLHFFSGMPAPLLTHTSAEQVLVIAVVAFLLQAREPAYVAHIRQSLTMISGALLPSMMGPDSGKCKTTSTYPPPGYRLGAGRAGLT